MRLALKSFGQRQLKVFLFCVLSFLSACKQQYRVIDERDEANRDLQPPPGGSLPAGKAKPIIREIESVARSQQVRGVWLTNVDSKILYSPEALERAFRRAASAGLNTVYISVWNKGHTLYPSPVAEKYLGRKVEPTRSLESWDMLSAAVELGKQYGIEVFTWFEYGLKIPSSSALFRNQPGWFTQKNDGKRLHQDGIEIAYLNPRHPEVSSFIQELIVDVVRRYDVAGVQIDDHFSMQKEFGYDALTLAAYRSASGMEPPIKVDDVKWVDFRAKGISDLVVSLSQAVKMVRPGVVFSVSPNAYPWSKVNFMQSWPDWVERNAVDELILQSYHEQEDRFLAEFEKEALVQAKGRVRHAAIGVLAGIANRRTPSNQLAQRIRQARERGYGVSFFFYETLFEMLPEGEEPADRIQALRLGFR